MPVGAALNTAEHECTQQACKAIWEKLVLGHGGALQLRDLRAKAAVPLARTSFSPLNSFLLFRGAKRPLFLQRLFGQFRHIQPKSGARRATTTVKVISSCWHKGIDLSCTGLTVHGLFCC